jgi:hypothetical protein
MDIQGRKLNFVQEFLRVADEELVIKLENLLQVERRRKLKMEPIPMTMEELKKKIEESESDFSNGRLTDAKDLLKQIDSWK